jgi:DNA-binding CsgD family transcriptional regulator
MEVIEAGIVLGKTNPELAAEVGVKLRTVKQLTTLVYRQHGLEKAPPGTNRLKLARKLSKPEQPKQKVELDLLPRERQVLDCIAGGHNIFWIMKVTGLTYATSKNVVRMVMEKTGMGTRLEVMQWARAHEY